MLRRKDRNLLIAGDVVMAKSEIDGDVWRGLKIADGASFRIPDVRRFADFRTWLGEIGWMVDAPPETLLRVSFLRHGGNEVVSTRDFYGSFRPVFLPWPKALSGKLDLLVEAIGTAKASIFLANHRALSRKWLIDAAVGTGIEIGPGAQPQILPRNGVSVSYLEQMPPEEWNRLYNGGGKYQVRPELWDNYVVGDAQNLPLADASLDFIFASHVFEHLANPIGHLASWQRKLAPGGKVICVVPDLNGTRDAVQSRSTMEEWLAEERAGTWGPELSHYMRHLRRDADDPELLAAMARRESIHVHYYDNINAQILLEHAVNFLGFADYLIEHTPNHKDFHFILLNR
jgi:SAM-dependent methyltransferase